MNNKKFLIPMLLLLGIAIFQSVTMPAFFYPGDNFAIRAETANWVNTGRLGIDYSQREQLGGMLSEKGQYFFENDVKQKFYSRYGFGDTVLFIPPYAVYKAIYGPAAIMGSSKDLLFIINIYMILFVTTSGLLLYLTAGLFTSKQWIRVAFTLASLYATFCAHYLKQPLHENFQITLSLAFFYFALRFFTAENETRFWWNIGAASLAAGLLVTTKSSFVLYYVAMGITILIDGFIRHGKNFRAVLWTPMGRYLLWIGVPVMLALAVLLISNTARFGSPLDSGYGQWMRDGAKTDYFSLSLLKTTLPGFLWKPGNHNLFLHYPLIIPALPGFFLLYRRSRTAFWFVLISTLLYFAAIFCYSGWHGGWCYGPRHLIFILMSSSIPAVFFIEKAAGLPRDTKWATLLLCGLIAGYSAFSNFQLNTIHCFAYQQLSSIFSQIKLPALSAYFNDYYTRGHIYRDIRQHAEEKKVFPPLQELQARRINPQVYHQLDAFLRLQGQPNYFFAKKKPPAR